MEGASMRYCHALGTRRCLSCHSRQELICFGMTLVAQHQTLVYFYCCFNNVPVAWLSSLWFPQHASLLSVFNFGFGWFPKQTGTLSCHKLNEFLIAYTKSICCMNKDTIYLISNKPILRYTELSYKIQFWFILMIYFIYNMVYRFLKKNSSKLYYFIHTIDVDYVLARDAQVRKVNQPLFGIILNPLSLSWQQRNASEPRCVSCSKPLPPPGTQGTI